MKRAIAMLAVAAVALMLSACATVNVDQTKIATVTHADLRAAAAYAAKNGYPDRAAVYTAIDTQLTACNNAITAAEPHAPMVDTLPGAFTAFEIAAEAAGNVSGIPAAVKIHCAALPIVTFPTLRLP